MQFQFSENNENRQRFLREAEITGALEHPGIVPVYGCGKYSDGRPFFAMRLIRGKSLKQAIAEFQQTNRDDWIQPAVRAELRRLLTRLIDVCNAVDYAHHQGVLHRDVKPSNIMLGDFGETLLVDWGLSKPLGDVESKSDGIWHRVSSPSSSVSPGGSTVGTPAYMSPEQASGEHEVDERSDVFSLGATLYCVLTGRPPHAEDDPSKTLDKAKSGKVTPPQEINKGAPKALASISMKAMHADPKMRYQTAREMARDIENWIADERVSAYDEPPVERAFRWTRRHRAWATSSVAAMLLITIVFHRILDDACATESHHCGTGNRGTWSCESQSDAGRFGANCERVGRLSNGGSPMNAAKTLKMLWLIIKGRSITWWTPSAAQIRGEQVKASPLPTFCRKPLPPWIRILKMHHSRKQRCLMH